MINVCLSHDIDRTRKTYQYFTKSIISILKCNFKGVSNQLLSLMKSNQYWTFRDFIDIEQSFNIRSTVFFLNETIKTDIFRPSSYKLSLGRYSIRDKKIIDIILWLDRNGWEIGVHGSYNSYKDKDLLSKEKQILENIVGHNIIGIRQHYLNLDENTWKYQKELGFEYDTSWGHTNSLGFKGGKYLPFHPFNDSFTVFPLVISDTNFMAAKNKWEEFEKLTDICQTTGAVMVINFHQHVFNEYDFPGFKQAYIDLIRKLINKNAVFTTLSQTHQRKTFDI